MNNQIMSIGMVKELTGLSERQIRYYEERQLVFPARTKGGSRRYSFEDVRKIKEIHQKLKEGFNTFELKEKRGQRNVM
ncbi:MerR family transcriptional regulator [Paenibacillus sp. Marseille-Q4541]|uniref:MerR family transcriptional regulator n=1 Tax=Paenibacillus sp. Marseille-Q4541 TaxID=2831522 RepID=UPI0024B5D2B7|nr:MerR family transcriptional regulator [Paenibacillus sp. Marseille-Q4541]